MDSPAIRTERNYWALLANPLVFRVEAAIRELTEATWTTKGRDITAGDRALIWKAKADDPVRGVVALAEILTDPAPMAGVSKFWVNPGDGQTVEDRVRVRFINAPNLPLWLDGPSGVVLRDLSVSRATGGTVFHVTPDQWAAVVAAAGGWADSQPSLNAASMRTLAGLTDPHAVTQALDEFDRIGREAFLDRYGFSEARAYFVERDNVRYDSKAIAGVAFGYQHQELGPLSPAEFSGGDQHVARRLEALGFNVVRVGPAANPDWHRDEVVLVLDFYVNGIAGRLPSNDTDPRVIELSETLQSLPIHPPDARATTFRNSSGVYLKLANFRAIDPTTDRRGAIHVSRLDRAVWEELAHDPVRLRSEALQVLTRNGLLADAAPEVSEAEDAIEALASGYRRSRGQGFQSSPVVRRAIEDEAMRRAIAYFQQQGWSVEDVSRRQSYDLHCTKSDGSELRVEVKGTQGDGSAILLTANEVEHARQFHPNVSLFVVARLTVSEQDAVVAVGGGEELVVHAWTINEVHLRPMSFEYRVTR